MIVYMLSSWNLKEAKAGYVVKETAAQYKVKERHWNNKGFRDRESTWRKNQCYTTIELAQAALIQKADEKVELEKRRLNSARSEFGVACVWSGREKKILSEMDPF